MATVRFSGELKDSILEAAKNTFKSRLALAMAPPPGAWADFMYDTAFGNDVKHIEALPTEYFHMEGSLELRTLYLGSRDSTLQIDTTLPFAAPRRMPFKLPNKHKLSFKHDWSHSAVNYRCSTDDESDVLMFETFKDWKNNITQLNEQRDEFKKSVEKLIGQFVTLAPALKAWPPLWDLLPDATKERHKEVVESKRGTNTDLSDIDLSSMTANVVVAKITK